MHFLWEKSAIQRRTWLLYLMFFLSLCIYVAMLDMIILFFRYIFCSMFSYSCGLFYDLSILPIPSVVFALILIGLSVFRILSLRHDGGVGVAKSFRAKQVEDDTKDPNLRRLRNVVEEISISAGLPVPVIFVLTYEKGINAFVAGYTPYDSVVVVTQGALTYLNRNELQGVIAHEFSHILNGDIAININITALLYGITIFSTIARSINLSVGNENDSMVLRDGIKTVDNNLLIVIFVGLPLALFSSIGLALSRLIKAAISRQRETLADMNAVRLTRSPDGLFGALLKINGIDVGSKFSDPSADEVSHMLFSEHSYLMNAMATHPPLLKRLKAINPRFDLTELAKLRKKWQEMSPNGLEEDGLMFMSDTQNGTQAIIGKIPEELEQAARNQYAIPSLLAALLFDQDKITFEKQCQVFKEKYSETLLKSAKLFFDQITEIDVRLRLALVSLSFPALRQLSVDKLNKLVDLINALINVDGEITLYEYCLATMMTTQIDNFISPGKVEMKGQLNVHQVANEIAILMNVLAQVGHSSQEEAKLSYTESMAKLLPDVKSDYQVITSFAKALDSVWVPLNRLDSANKKILIDAMVVAINRDNVITIGEAELLRTVSAIIHFPLPANLAEIATATP